MQLEQHKNNRTVVIGLTALPFIVLMFVAFLPLPKYFRWHEGDLWHYWNSSLKLLQGQLPYRDFPLEYPPLALLPFVLPHLVTLNKSLNFNDYVLFFVLQNAALSSLVSLVLVEVVSYWQRKRNTVPILLVYALLILVSVPLLPWRYDLFPALLTLLAMLSVMAKRPMVAGFWLGFGSVVKLYPVLLLPVFSAYYLAGKEYRMLLRLLLSSVGTIGIFLLPFILVAPGNLFSFLSYHQMRGLQLESVAAGVISLAHVLGLTEAKLVHNFGALHLESPLADIALKLLPLAFILVFGVMLVNCLSRFWEERTKGSAITSESLVAYVVLSLLTFIVTNKVFSPQYIIWLLPFAPLLRFRQAVLLLVISMMTIVIFPFAYEDILAMRFVAVLVLNLRNILVMVLTLWLLVEYMPTPVQAALSTQYHQEIKPHILNIPWFKMGMISLFLMSVVVRFWGLSRFNTLVFDEVYFVKYAKDYLTHTPFFDVHPPLGKYLIAIGIWISNFHLFGSIWQNSLTSQLSAFSYRWLNALTGSLIPLVVVGVAYQLSHRRSYALIAGLFAAADGLLLVESRYALLNVYLIIFGLLGQWFFLLALDNQFRRRRFWLTLAGICFGASASVKWYSLGFLLGTYLIWASVWGVQWLQSFRGADIRTNHFNSAVNPPSRQNLLQLRFLHLVFYLGIIPAVVYCLLWVPHLQLNPTLGFWELHKRILVFHKQLGSGVQEHPYCSSWYTWPWTIRPVGYLYKTSSTSIQKQVVYDVHGMGNPILWWLAAIAIILLLWMLVATSYRSITEQSEISLTQTSNWITLYLLLNFGTNWLPWMIVTRCAFIYYYMGAAVFGFLAIAWFVDQLLYSYHVWQRALGITAIFLILLGFVYWLPIYLGLPLAPEQFHSRMWFHSWY